MTKTFITYEEIMEARKNGMDLYGDVDNALLTRAILVANNFEKNNQPIDRKALDALLWLLVEKGFEADEALAEKAEKKLADEVGTLKNSVHDVSVVLSDDDEYTVFFNMILDGYHIDCITVGRYDTEEGFEEILVDLISLSSKYYNIRFLSNAGYETNLEPEIELLRVNFLTLAHEMKN